MRYVAKQILLALALLILAILIAVQWVAYDPAFMARELIRLNSPQAVGISEADLMRYIEHTARYLRGAEQDPNFRLVIAGEEGWFLGEREVLHMQDVQHLFSLAKYLAVFLAIVLVALFILAYRTNKLAQYLHCLARGSLLAILMGILSAALISLDFNRSFTLFHLLSFSNDLWLLDPATERLINLLPEAFFATAALQTALRAAALLSLLAVLSYWLRHRAIRDHRPL